MGKKVLLTTPATFGLLLILMFCDTNALPKKDDVDTIDVKYGSIFDEIESSFNNDLTILQDGGEESSMPDKTFIRLPDGSTATYREYDRNLTLEDFNQVQNGSTYASIVELFGEPNGDVGSGWISPYYSLSDGTYILFDCIIYKDRPDLPEPKIYNIRIMDANGNLTFFDQSTD